MSSTSRLWSPRASQLLCRLQHMRGDDDTTACDSAQHDVLRDFLDHWDDELRHEDAFQSADGAADGAADAPVTTASPKQVKYKKETPTPSRQGDSSSQESAMTSTELLVVDLPPSSHESCATAVSDAGTVMSPEAATPAAPVVCKHKRRKFEIMLLGEEAKALEQHHLKLREHLLKQAGPEHQLQGVLLRRGAHTLTNGK